MKADRIIPLDNETANHLGTKLTQLSSLLYCCYGIGADWLDEIGQEHRDNIMWIASDLAEEAKDLLEQLRAGANAAGSALPSHAKAPTGLHHEP